MQHVLVRGTKVLNAAKKFIQLQNVKEFKASKGWLFQFKLLQASHGEVFNCDKLVLEEFCNSFSYLTEKESLLNQIYNADETSLFYCSTPTNTLAAREEKIPGHKLSKQRISFLCCANATGLHQLKLVVAGKAKQPHCLRRTMAHLSVVCFHSLKA